MAAFLEKAKADRFAEMHKATVASFAVARKD
jgi:hypothetical protein